MKLLRALAVSLVLAAGACDPGDSTPCASACRPGETCTLGVCVAECNPRCGASQQCVLSGGATMCVRVDAGTPAPDAAPPDVAAPDVPAPDDAPDLPAPPDAAPDAPAPPDVAVDAPAPMDAPADVPAPMDAAPDAPPDVGMDAPADLPRDTAPVDVPDAAVLTDAPAPMDAGPPPCGNRDQPCCGPSPYGSACRSGLVCNAYMNGRCVEAASRASDECVSNATCPTGRVCTGPTGCADGRWCYRCAALVGTMPFDSTCNRDLGGRDCATGVCDLRSRCSWACSPGAVGDEECGRLAFGSRCVATLFGLDLNDAGEPGRRVTLGSCVPGCQRDSDCTGGRACVATANLLEDRVDFACLATTRTGAAGATCSAMMPVCRSALCITVPEIGGRCTAPCTADADCPAAAPLCRELTLTRPTSGTAQIARGCVPRS